MEYKTFGDGLWDWCGGKLLMICFLNDPGWRSQRAATLCVLRAAAAVGHILLSGVYGSNPAGPSPAPPSYPPLVLLLQNGQLQVKQINFK